MKDLLKAAFGLLAVATIALPANADVRIITNGGERVIVPHNMRIIIPSDTVVRTQAAVVSPTVQPLTVIRTGQPAVLRTALPGSMIYVRSAPLNADFTQLYWPAFDNATP